ncbi:MAG: hypothetical protein EPN26_02940 [Rhodospirillales bacterium]|nr:MAG: hypothetical protein EPN26_02940 [Rhodospirillales bacterium]
MKTDVDESKYKIYLAILPLVIMLIGLAVTILSKSVSIEDLPTFVAGVLISYALSFAVVYIMFRTTFFRFEKIVKGHIEEGDKLVKGHIEEGKAGYDRLGNSVDIIRDVAMRIEASHVLNILNDIKHTEGKASDIWIVARDLRWDIKNKDFIINNIRRGAKYKYFIPSHYYEEATGFVNIITSDLQVSEESASIVSVDDKYFNLLLCDIAIYNPQRNPEFFLCNINISNNLDFGIDLKLINEAGAISILNICNSYISKSRK